MYQPNHAQVAVCYWHVGLMVKRVDSQIEY